MLAYGATGAGKTHTMHGPHGVVPAAAAAIALAADERRRKGWTTTVTATAVEVYAEKCYDLLGDHATPLQLTSEGDVRGATRVEVAAGDAAALSRLVARAAAARRTASTALNDRSSRSHALVRLALTGDDGAEITRGSLTLADLAGSERADRAGTAKPGGDDARLKEACAINRSLSCLVDVFRALAARGKSRKAEHVPYRNSVLTRLLQKPLSGDGKALLAVHVAPDQALESTATLRFAADVSLIETGRPTRDAVAKRGLRPHNAGGGVRSK